jgi:hypothetical protein
LAHLATAGGQTRSAGGSLGSRLGTPAMLGMALTTGAISA